jgi:hypothetical protein
MREAIAKGNKNISITTMGMKKTKIKFKNIDPVGDTL